MKIKYLFLTAIFISMTTQTRSSNDDYHQKYHLGKLLNLIKNRDFMSIIINEKDNKNNSIQNANFSNEKISYKKKIKIWLNKLLEKEDCLDLAKRNNYERCYLFADMKLKRIFGLRWSSKFHPKKFSRIIENFLNYLLPFQINDDIKPENNLDDLDLDNLDNNFSDSEKKNLFDFENENSVNTEFKNEKNKNVTSITNHHISKVINKKHIRNHKNINNITVNIYVNNPDLKNPQISNLLETTKNLENKPNIHNMDLRVSKKGKFDVKKLRNFFKNGEYKKDLKNEKTEGVVLPFISKENFNSDSHKIIFDDANQKLKGQKNHEKSYKDL